VYRYHGERRYRWRIPSIVQGLPVKVALLRRSRRMLQYLEHKNRLKWPSWHATPDRHDGPEASLDKKRLDIVQSLSYQLLVEQLPPQLVLRSTCLVTPWYHVHRSHRCLLSEELSGLDLQKHTAFSFARCMTFCEPSRWFLSRLFLHICPLHSFRNECFLSTFLLQKLPRVNG